MIPYEIAAAVCEADVPTVAAFLSAYLSEPANGVDDDVDDEDEIDRTPLLSYVFWDCRCRYTSAHVEMVRLLVSLGVDVHQTFSVHNNVHELTPLHHMPVVDMGRICTQFWLYWLAPAPRST